MNHKGRGNTPMAPYTDSPPSGRGKGPRAPCRAQRAIRPHLPVPRYFHIQAPLQQSPAQARLFLPLRTTAETPGWSKRGGKDLVLLRKVVTTG